MQNAQKSMQFAFPKLQYTHMKTIYGERTLPLYMQIYLSLREKIETGEYPYGYRLLSIRNAAYCFSVNPGTIIRVYRLMTLEGYIKNINNHGFAVIFNEKTDEKKMIRKRYEAEIRKELE